MNKITVYTDGACSGNPGPGGYAAVLLYNELEKIVAGGEAETTNNRMELKAVIEGLKAIKNKKLPVEVFTDSTYVQKGITEWIENWKKKNWKKVKNIDLWQELDKQKSEFKSIKFFHVKGHSGNIYNEKCDKIARQQILNFNR
jgi:ribonuclease HI